MIHPKVEEFKDRIVAVERRWNNSMYIYDDYIDVWNGKGVDKIYLGTDVFDAIGLVEINKKTPAYVAYTKCITEKQKKENQRRRCEQFERYAHHFPLEIKIVDFLESLPTEEKHLFDRLLGVKKFRSKFRESLCRQVLEWLGDKNKKYDFPLSPKQMKCLRSQR